MEAEVTNRPKGTNRDAPPSSASISPVFTPPRNARRRSPREGDPEDRPRNRPAGGSLRSGRLAGPQDGSYFWANVVIDPIRDSDGYLVGFAKVTRDLTEHRAAEEELHEARSGSAFLFRA